MRTEKEAIKRYDQEMITWEEKYKIENKPTSISFNQWLFEKHMNKPNKPGYDFANND